MRLSPCSSVSTPQSRGLLSSLRNKWWTPSSPSLASTSPLCYRPAKQNIQNTTRSAYVKRWECIHRHVLLLSPAISLFRVLSNRTLRMNVKELNNEFDASCFCSTHFDFEIARFCWYDWEDYPPSVSVPAAKLVSLHSGFVRETTQERTGRTQHKLAIFLSQLLYTH